MTKLRLSVRPILALLALGTLLVAGCTASQPASFYTLSGLQPAGARVADEALDSPGIGLGPISLPEYLDRPQIVTRASANKLELSEFHRWAEPLERIFSRVLAENMSILLDGDRVVLLPLRRGAPTGFQVEVEVAQFDTETSGTTVLAARWSVYRRNDDEPLVTRNSVVTQQVASPGDFEAVVAAMSRTLGDLSQDIATAIKRISREAGQSSG